MLADMLVNFDYDQYFEQVLFVYHCVKFIRWLWTVSAAFSTCVPSFVLCFLYEIDSINFVSRYFMASNASSGSNIDFTPSKSDDPVWAHCIKVLGKKNQTICLYCNKHIQSGGITHLKQHLAEILGDVGNCSKILCAMANETIACWFFF